MHPDEIIIQHYARGEIGAAVLAVLRAMGKDTDALQAADLAPLDQFHTRGRPATLELAQMANLHAGETVLDVGGGIGGAARVLAQDFGCDVTVVDLTPEYVQVGEMLTARTHLEDRVRFRQGSALTLPFEDASFDVVWTQHSAMNIANKGRLWVEMHRVLTPGGRLAVHEIVAGPNAPVHFPVPWATTPDASFLEPPEAMLAHITAAGFRERAWHEQTGKAIEWFRMRNAALRTGALPPLGLHLLLGEPFVPMMRNILRNYEEGGIRVFMGVFEKI